MTRVESYEKYNERREFYFEYNFEGRAINGSQQLQYKSMVKSHRNAQNPLSVE